MGGQSVYVLDEITNGLDSDTAHRVVRLLHSLAHEQGATVVCSLVHPDPNLLELFDHLLLMAAGQHIPPHPHPATHPYGGVGEFLTSISPSVRLRGLA